MKLLITLLHSMLFTIKVILGQEVPDWENPEIFAVLDPGMTKKQQHW
jgi:hypothetical protein